MKGKYTITKNISNVRRKRILIDIDHFNIIT